MISRRVKLKNQQGLHLRPARELCSMASGYEGTSVMIHFRGREFNAKSMLSILSACVQKEDEVELVCSGPQEQEAAETLAVFLETDGEGPSATK